MNQLPFNVNLLPCPPAFTLSEAPYGCICEERLQKYTNSCDINDQTILRDGDFWVGYDNQSNGLILHPHCPFHYCKSKVVNFSLEEVDLQCDHNRTGLLCGACLPGLSLALGSSRCLPCSNDKLALLLAFAVMGFVFVLFLFLFRLTVTIGTISGLIFYVNIVGANENAFFPPGRKNYLGSTVFIAWIKLNLGIETCFYDGLDTYTKTWFQFVFPMYLFGIILLIILFFKCAPKKFLRDIAEKKLRLYEVLATLFVLSYGKILHTIISAMSYTTLQYPNDTTEVVWLYDGNIKFLHGKHIPLFIVSVLFFLLVFLPFTLLLLFGQCLKGLFSKFRCLSWMTVVKVLDIYYKPYDERHHYWPGLLLVIRLGLLVMFGANALHDNDENLLAISAAAFGLLAWPWMTRGHVYREELAWRGALEGSYFLNLGVFSIATFYVREAGGNQALVAYISTAVAFLSFIGTLIFHVYLQTKQSMYGRVICQCCKLFNRREDANPEEIRPLVN